MILNTLKSVLIPKRYVSVEHKSDNSNESQPPKRLSAIEKIIKMGKNKTAAIILGNTK